MAVKKKKVIKKKVTKAKTPSAKKKSPASKKGASAKKAVKSSKKKTAVKKKPKTAVKKKPKTAAKKGKAPQKAKAVVKKPASNKKAVKAAPKKVVKPAPAKKAPEPPEEIIKPVVKSPFKKGDSKILKIQERLNHDRKRLRSMLRSSQEVERTINDITFSNEIDLASSLEGREMAFQLSSRERNELRMVEEALFKITADTYGVCDSCSKYIILKRLEIMPLTALCIECQENLEVH